MNKIPVHLITGFLGSGKTTFLNHFIQERLPERILVIENEVGETNIDGALVVDGVEEVVELSAGCLCCSLADGLLDILEHVSEKRDQYDRIVIETTGIADPSSIVQTFLANPMVERIFNLEQVICLADAEYLEDWLEETEEALRQIALADAILINKIDAISRDYLPELKSSIEKINPQAYVFAGSHGQFPVSEIMKVGSKSCKSVEAKLNPKKEEHTHNCGHDHQYGESCNHSHEERKQDYHQDHETNNSHGITTFTLTFDQPFNLEALSKELNMVLNLFRSNLYRVKGILSVQDYPNRVVLQSVRTTFVATDGRSWKENESRVSKLVFIGRGLKKEAFEDMLVHHLENEKISL